MMDFANAEFTLLQRQQLQHSVLAPLRRIKAAIGQGIRPQHVDIMKSLLNREVRNFMLVEVFDGEHLIDVFDLCYGLDNLKFIERLLNEAELQQLAEMVRSWKSRNKSLVPNVFYQYGFFPLWIRINLNFIQFLKYRDDIFNTLRSVFGIPSTEDPAIDPLVFMGVSLRKQDMLLCVLVPQSQRHHIKTSLQSPHVASQLKNRSVTGIYFSRIKKRFSRDDVTGSQLSLSSACESMTSDDFGELYDAAFEDITNKYCNETVKGGFEYNERPRESHWTTMDKQFDNVSGSTLDGNKRILNSYHRDEYQMNGHYVNENTKPQLVRISSNYVPQVPSSVKSKQTFDENGNVIKGSNNELSCRHVEGNVSKDSKPRLVQISSGYVGQDPSNKVAKVEDKKSYGKCFVVDYRSLAQQKSPLPKYQSSPIDDKIGTTVVTNYNDRQNKSSYERHESRDAQDNILFSPRSEFSFEEPTKIGNELDNDLSTWSSSVNKETMESPWYKHGPKENWPSAARHTENKPIGDVEEPEHARQNKYHHGNDRYGNNEGAFQAHANSNHEFDHSKYYQEGDKNRRTYYDDKSINRNGYHRDREAIPQTAYNENSNFPNYSEQHQSYHRYSEKDKNFHPYGDDNEDLFFDESQRRHHENVDRPERITDHYYITNNHRGDTGWYEHKENTQYNRNNNTHGNHDDNHHHGNFDDGYYRNKNDALQSCDQGHENSTNSNHGNRNDVMIPEPEPPRLQSDSLPLQPSSAGSVSSNGFDLGMRRSTPNSSASGFSTHELSYNKPRRGDISRSMPILYPSNHGQRSPCTPRKPKPKYESQADLDDSVFVGPHDFDMKPGSSPQLFLEPPPYHEAMIKKSYMSLSSVSVDFKCKNVKSPLLSSHSVGSIYREKEQLLNREELQESIRSAEVREWEKLLDKTKDFMKAAKVGDDEEVQHLLTEGVDADYKNEFGHTALMIASREGHLPVIQVLTTFNAELNIQDKYGKSALHEAAWSGQHHVIHPLVSKGAHIDIVDEEGKTPLQYASLRGKTKVAEILLLLGANPSVENKDGETAIELAYKCKHKDIVKLFLDSSDKETRKTMHGQIRKLQFQRIKSATSLPNLSKDNRSKDFDQSRNKIKMRRQRSCATQ